MNLHLSPLALCLIASAFVLCVGILLSIKFRTTSKQIKNVRIYDFSADLKLPMRRSRSYQFALYITLKSLPREPEDRPIPTPAQWPQ